MTESVVCCNARFSTLAALEQTDTSRSQSCCCREAARGQTGDTSWYGSDEGLQRCMRERAARHRRAVLVLELLLPPSAPAAGSAALKAPRRLAALLRGAWY